MDKDIQTWLYDILLSINEIDSYFETDKRFLKYIEMILKQNGLLKETLKLLVKQ